LCRWILTGVSLTLIHGLPGQVQAEPLPMVLINASGAEFSGEVLPGENGTHYFFPRDGFFAHWKARGIRTVRFPMLWERLQPELGGELDHTYAGLVDKMLDQAEREGVEVILDVHNYGRYRGKVIGSPEVRIADYRQLMLRIAKRWNTAPALYAYDLMNEPHDESDARWPEVAQAGIDAIRTVDPRRLIIVEGRSWSSAARWPQFNDGLLALNDPADNLVFSAHLYMDEDGGGEYRKTRDMRIDPDVAVKRVRPFIQWLKQHGRRGQIGEMGFPDDDPRWLEATDRLLGYLRRHCVPLVYWSAGEFWGDYKLAVEPRNGRDRPQWQVLSKYLEAPQCTDYGPAAPRN